MDYKDSGVGAAVVEAVVAVAAKEDPADILSVAAAAGAVVVAADT